MTVPIVLLRNIARHKRFASLAIAPAGFALIMSTVATSALAADSSMLRAYTMAPRIQPRPLQIDSVPTETELEDLSSPLRDAPEEAAAALVEPLGGVPSQQPSAAIQPPSTPAPAPLAVNPSLVRPDYGVITYSVGKGDTMFSIARKVNLPLSTLAAINNIADPNLVKAGQPLYIPAQPGTVHVVAKGDSVASLADVYQASTDSIFDANRLNKDAQLEAGQPVLIPGVVRASAATIKPITPSPTAGTPAPAQGVFPAPPPKSAQPESAQAASPNLKPAQGNFGDTMIWPVSGPLSTTFSPTHRGLDVAANFGAPIKSALAGRVIGATEGDGPYGWFIIVEHGGGFTSVHAHLSKIRVKVGDIVEKGQIIGEVGSSGLSTGPHLHFELRQGNVPIDPRPYLP